MEGYTGNFGQGHNMGNAINIGLMQAFGDAIHISDGRAMENAGNAACKGFISLIIKAKLGAANIYRDLRSRAIGAGAVAREQ